VNITDALAMKPHFGSADRSNYRARLDFTADEVINISDVGVLGNWFLDSCPFFYQPYTRIVSLYSQTTHLTPAPTWLGNLADMAFVYSAIYPTPCTELQRAGEHWTNTTDFFFPLLGGLSGCVGLIADVIFDWGPLQCDPTFCYYGATYPYEVIAGRLCTDSNPCHPASFAQIRLNSNSPMPNDAGVRHVVLAHELGHVAGAGHPVGDSGPCTVPPWTIMGGDVFCYLAFDSHVPRPSDVLFTNIKY
jgi:hypothetical protein